MQPGQVWKQPYAQRIYEERAAIADDDEPVYGTGMSKREYRQYKKADKREAR